MIVYELSFTEIREVELVDHSWIDGPGLVHAVLLVSDVVVGSEAGNICTGGLKARERLLESVVIEVGVGIELMLIGNLLIDASSPLVCVVELVGNALIIT